ncbi:hypothetical protein [Streptomyces sp. NBC_01373]|nr:hypothetical protein [Streptomyces sp. NBC_01373]MCX4705285.1 hypothetical protein [Streptomyces sp. NBC_01373]
MSPTGPLTVTQVAMRYRLLFALALVIVVRAVRRRSTAPPG